VEGQAGQGLARLPLSALACGQDIVASLEEALGPVTEGPRTFPVCLLPGPVVALGGPLSPSEQFAALLEVQAVPFSPEALAWLAHALALGLGGDPAGLLAAYEEALKEQLDLRSNFISAMHHELRTPLNAILGFSRLLEKGTPGALNDKQARYVDNIRQSGQRLLNAVEDLLDEPC